MRAGALGRRVPGAIALGIQGLWVALFVVIALVSGGPLTMRIVAPAIAIGLVVAGLSLFAPARRQILVAGLVQFVFLAILTVFAIPSSGYLAAGLGVTALAFLLGSFNVARHVSWTVAALVLVGISVPFLVQTKSDQPVLLATLPVSAVLLAGGAWLNRPPRRL